MLIAQEGAGPWHGELTHQKNRNDRLQLQQEPQIAGVVEANDPRLNLVSCERLAANIRTEATVQFILRNIFQAGSDCGFATIHLLCSEPPRWS